MRCFSFRDSDPSQPLFLSDFFYLLGLSLLNATKHPGLQMFHGFESLDIVEWEKKEKHTKTQ